MNKPEWISKLMQRWNLKSPWQVIVILLVFTCTGFTVLLIKKPLLSVLAGDNGDTVLASIIYYLLILPVYNVLLLGYGFVFGHFNFFWDFEKRFFKRIFSIFKNNKQS